jgi:hypothetical protein
MFIVWLFAFVGFFSDDVSYGLLSGLLYKGRPIQGNT